MNQIKVFNKESFKITGRGVIVFLKHKEIGLAKGWTLKSELTNNAWKIDSRILCDHAIDKHNFFDNESINSIRMSFKNEEKKNKSIKRIIEEESKNIFQYLIKPIGHDEKPLENELLILKKENEKT